MRKSILKTTLLTAMLCLPTVAWAVDSGPAKGAAPMLDVKPVNVQGDAYCFTCDAGLNPAVALFVHDNTEATQQLVLKLDGLYQHGSAQKLHAAVVITRGGQECEGLVAFARDHHLKVPVAVVTDADALKDWQLNADADNTVVYLNGHKVDHSAANVTPDAVAADTAKLLGAAHGGAHHQH